MYTLQIFVFRGWVGERMVARTAQRGPSRRRAHPVSRTSIAHSAGHTCDPLRHHALLRVNLRASLLYLRCVAHLSDLRHKSHNYESISPQYKE